jgi:hypothetical protein
MEVVSMKKPTLKIDEDGTKEWAIRGLFGRSITRHRTDGPAAEYSSGTKEWYIDGNLHRTDGPAIEWSNGDKTWWLNGYRYDTFDEYAKAVNWTDEQIIIWKLTHTRK